MSDHALVVATFMLAVVLTVFYLPPALVHCWHAYLDSER